MAIIPEQQRIIQLNCSVQEATDKLSNFVQQKSSWIISSYAKPFYGIVSSERSKFRVSMQHRGFYWVETHMTPNDLGTLMTIDMSIPRSLQVASVALLAFSYLGMALPFRYNGGLQSWQVFGSPLIIIGPVVLFLWYLMNEDFRASSRELDSLEASLLFDSKHDSDNRDSKDDASPGNSNFVGVDLASDQTGAIQYLLGEDYAKEFGRSFLGTLKSEGTNATDSNAVQVLVGSQLVGYVSEDAARIFKQAEVAGMIPNGVIDTMVTIKESGDHTQEQEPIYSAKAFFPSINLFTQQTTSSLVPTLKVFATIIFLIVFCVGIYELALRPILVAIYQLITQ